MRLSPFKLWLFNKYREERHAARQAARVYTDSAPSVGVDNHYIPQRSETDMSTTWSAPYHGVSHSQTAGKKSYGTTQQRGDWIELILWFPGCGYDPIRQNHDSITDAQLAYNEWIKTQV